MRPEYQRQGIGTALINEGLDRLRQKGASGCILIGDPNYYSRFGFVSDGRLSLDYVEDRFVQWLGFGKEPPRGTPEFDDAFEPDSAR